VSQKFFHHYRGFFGRTCQDWRTAQPPTVKGLLYAYRSGLTGIHLLRTGECVGDVTRLAPIYGFDQVPELVAQNASGKEHGALGEARGRRRVYPVRWRYVRIDIGLEHSQMKSNASRLAETKRRGKRERLEARGWTFGSTPEFLGLAREEEAYLQLRYRLAEALRQRRQARRLSQTELAARLRTSQSRLAKMEAGDPSVSVDLLIRSLLALGLSTRALARAIAGRSAPASE
jgi:ribosome-binding protein aMBF1 (putative translation factor)